MRPDADTFRELCKTMTATEIAKHCGVTVPTIAKWSRAFKCRPRKGVVGPDWRKGPHVDTPANHRRYRGWHS